MRAAEPSERNFSIFCEVEFEGASLREAAAAYEISTTRVQQIVDQTREWYIDTTPEWVRETEPSTQPLLACRMHQARLQHLYGEAMRAWKDSQTDVTTTRVRPSVLGSGELRVTQPSFGQTRYLSAAMQLSRAQIDAAERLAAICEKQAAKTAGAVESQAEPTACAPCAPQMAIAPQVVETEEDVVALSLEGQESSVEPASLPLTTCVAPHSAATPVRSRKQQRKLERHRRRSAQRKQGNLAG